MLIYEQRKPAMSSFCRDPELRLDGKSKACRRRSYFAGFTDPMQPPPASVATPATPGDQEAFVRHDLSSRAFSSAHQPRPITAAKASCHSSNAACAASVQ